jgi:sigma-E factor negative regulatory protein RseA
MSKETREHISSLMDGEISREASRFLVRRLGTDEELCATWARYHVVRDCLRDHDGGIAQGDLCSRVRKVLDEEDSVQMPRRSASRWFKPVAGAAIAASVALMAVMAVDPGESVGDIVPANVSGNTVAESFNSPQGISASAVVSRTVSSQKMDSYLLRHYQATGAGNGRTFAGFVPVIISKQVATDQGAVEPAEAESNGEKADSPDP